MVNVKEYEQYTIEVRRISKSEIIVEIKPKPDFDPSINFKIDLISNKFTQTVIMKGTKIKEHNSGWSKLDSADSIDDIYVIVSQVVYEETNKIELPIQKTKWEIKKEKAINYCVRIILYLRRYLLWQR